MDLSDFVEVLSGGWNSILKAHPNSVTVKVLSPKYPYLFTIMSMKLDEIRVTSSEGLVPFDESTTPMCSSATSSTPWSFCYRLGSHDTAAAGRTIKESSNSANASPNNTQGSKIEESEQLFHSTPIMTRVHYRRLAQDEAILATKSPVKRHEANVLRMSNTSKKIIKKPQVKPLISPARPPLVELCSQQTASSPIRGCNEIRRPFFFTVSRSSSSTSVASSISPLVTPFERFQKRSKMKNGENDREGSVPTLESDQKYQQLMTKYYKAKRMILQLKDQNKLNQRRIALLEFTRQQEAELSQNNLDNTAGNKARADMNNEDSGAGVGNENEPENAGKNERTSGIKNEDLVLSGSQDDTSKVVSYPEVKDELVKRIAAQISEQALRPVIFKVSLDSPPCKMNVFVESVNKAGKLCVSCGKKIHEKWKPAE